jgi:hypothetical protein
VEKTVEVAEVKGFRTKSGNIRFVLRDEEGNEYTTFKEAIGARALELEGRKAKIEYHEAQRDGYLNVYLDAVEPAEEGEEIEDGKVEEVAWQAAVEAAPLLVGPRQRAVPPDDLYGRLKPFKDLVAEDIREGSDE